MKETAVPNQPRRNLLTQIRHKREVFWQITMPLLAGLLFLVAAGVGVILGAAGTADVGRWADLSMIWLLVPAMFFTLLFLALVAGIVYGVTALLGVLPQYLYQVQNIFLLVKIRIARFADAAAEPMMRGHEYAAGLRRSADYLQKTFQPDKISKDEAGKNQ